MEIKFNYDELLVKFQEIIDKSLINNKNSNVSVKVPDIQLLTPDDLIKKLNICRAKVFELLNQGIIPSIKIGKNRLVKLQDLENYINSIPYSLPNNDKSNVKNTSNNEVSKWN